MIHPLLLDVGQLLRDMGFDLDVAIKVGICAVGSIAGWCLRLLWIDFRVNQKDKEIFNLKEQVDKSGKQFETVNAELVECKEVRANLEREVSFLKRQIKDASEKLKILGEWHHDSWVHSESGVAVFAASKTHDIEVNFTVNYLGKGVRVPDRVLFVSHIRTLSDPPSNEGGFLP